jgi:hypothetical protein
MSNQTPTQRFEVLHSGAADSLYLVGREGPQRFVHLAWAPALEGGGYVERIDNKAHITAKGTAWVNKPIWGRKG